MIKQSRTIQALLAGTSLVAGMAATSAANAQEWNTSIDLPRKTIIAYQEFDNGITVATRCADGDFEVILAGLPEVQGEALSRVLNVSVGDEPLSPETWSRGTSPTTAFSRLPAPFARRLAAGGNLQVSVPGAPGRPSTRYVMELSPSPTAVEQALNACHRPLVDPRDTLLARNASDGLAASADLPGLDWAVPPRPTYPMYAANGYASEGSVTLSCLARDDGSIASCVVESEHPPKFNFAREAVKAALRARLRLVDGSQGSMEGRLIVYSTTFKMARPSESGVRGVRP